MDYIINNIGNNKVNIQIQSNEFEETNCNKQDNHLFCDIENLIDIYKQSSPSRSSSSIEMKKLTNTIVKTIPDKTLSDTKLHTNQLQSFASKKKEIKSPQDKELHTRQESKKDVKMITGIDSLFVCIMEYLDPTLSLLSYESTLDKIQKFKSQISLDLNDPSYRKKSSYKYQDILNYLKEADEKVCIYLSDLIKKNIVIKSIVDNDIVECNLYPNDTIKECIVLHKFQNIYTYFKIDDIDVVKEDIIKFKILKYIKDGTYSKLDTYLVKDLKDIADNLNIQTYYKDDDNKRKSYLKNELKELIKKKFDLYK